MCIQGRGHSAIFTLVCAGAAGNSGWGIPPNKDLDFEVEVGTEFHTHNSSLTSALPNTSLFTFQPMAGAKKMGTPPANLLINQGGRDNVSG